MEHSVTDNIELATIYRLTAVNFWQSAKVLHDNIAHKGEVAPGNLRALPFYYLVSHAVELFLKSALLKRGFAADDLRQHPIRHNLGMLLGELRLMGVPIEPDTVSLVDALSRQHERHFLRYTSLLDDGQPTFTPSPDALFSLLEELMMATRIATH